MIRKSEIVQSETVRDNGSGMSEEPRNRRPEESSEERTCSFFRDDDGPTTSVDGRDEASREAPDFTPLAANSPVILKLNLESNFSISFSRSTINLSAGDCTRPAEIAPGTFLRTISDKSYPTSISSVCRACCDDTMSISTVRGF